jgi:hypothetical protein
MRRLTAFILAGLGTALALTACSAHPTTARTGTKPGSVATPSAVPIPATSKPAGPAAAQPNTAGVPTADRPALPAPPLLSGSAAACPVTADTLLAALKADDVRYAEAGRPAALDGATCYGPNALAHAVPDGVHQPPQTLFAVDPTTKNWRPVAVGTSAGFCRAYVSDDVRKGLGGC